jgi:UDP-N-acetylmuramyl pentapeptide phosphotransferase/UDP-N-acetylglucosamine-1-phosphate transferase
MWSGALAAAVVLAVTLPLTGLVARWLERRAILDRPVERSSHAVPVPRGGGLALVPVLVVVWLVLAAAGIVPAAAAGVAGLAAALALVSWLDDLRDLPAALRFLAHAAAALVGIACLPHGALVFQGVLPPLADRAAAVVLWVWFVNLFNFMDGIDGITGVETIAIAAGVTLALVVAGDGAGGLAILAPTLAAAAAGFLRWNWHPARIFLGDVGSVPLGFLLGFLLLGLAARGWWAPALILPLYYLTDATVTLARRLLRGEAVWRAHREHFYQRALAPDGDHAAVARLILAGDLVLVGLAVLALADPWPALALAAATVAGLLAILARRARRAPA